MGEEQLQTQLAAAQKYLDESNFNRAANAAACALEIDCGSYEARVYVGHFKEPFLTAHVGFGLKQ
jgi:hypothetical protein